MERRYYTTGQVAKILKISEKTAKNYCSQGKIEFESSPVTRHRKVSHESLRKFIDENGLPRELLKNHAPRKVLVVDDDELIVKLIVTWLRDMSDNLVIETAGDGYDACVKAGTFVPDIILLDLYMPRTDGFSVCRSIRANPMTKHAEIIIITGKGILENVGKLKDFGIRGIIEKPADEAILRRIIMPLLEKQEKVTQKKEARNEAKMV